jgi:hypothetical protein
MDFFRSLFLHNFWWKLFSVVLATLIWLAVNATLSNEAALSRRFALANVTHKFPHLPVLVMTGTGEHPAVTIEPSDVSVLVRGPAELLSSLQEQDVQVFLHLQEKNPFGDFPVIVHVPPGIKEVVAFPDVVAVRPASENLKQKP